MRHCPWTNKQKRRHFHAKTTCAKLYIYIGVGSRNLFIDEIHGSGHIPGIFSLHAAYSALRQFFRLTMFVKSKCTSFLFYLKVAENALWFGWVGSKWLLFDMVVKNWHSSHMVCSVVIFFINIRGGRSIQIGFKFLSNLLSKDKSQ